MKLVSYYGGKNNRKLMKKISRLVDIKHDTHIEPYAGSGGILLNSPKVAVEVVNDLSWEMSHLLKVMSDRNDGYELKEWLKKLEGYEELFEEALEAKKYNYVGYNDVERAMYEYVLLTFSFNNRKEYYSAYKEGGFKAQIDKNIDLVYKRLKDVKVCSKDAIDIVREFKGETDCLMVLDPPYCSWLRSPSAQNVYDVEADYSDQVKLLREITTSDVKAHIILFGYLSRKGLDLYDTMLLPHNWTRYLLADVPKSAANVKAGEEKPRGQEYIWLSPDYPLPYDKENYIDINTKTRWEDLFNE